MILHRRLAHMTRSKTGHAAHPRRFRIGEWPIRRLDVRHSNDEFASPPFSACSQGPVSPHWAELHRTHDSVEDRTCSADEWTPKAILPSNCCGPFSACGQGPHFSALSRAAAHMTQSKTGHAACAEVTPKDTRSSNCCTPFSACGQGPHFSALIRTFRSRDSVEDRTCGTCRSDADGNSSVELLRPLFGLQPGAELFSSKPNFSAHMTRSKTGRAALDGVLPKVTPSTNIASNSSNFFMSSFTPLFGV